MLDPRAALLVENAQRHPLTDDDQIAIDPGRTTHHPGVCDHVGSDIAEMAGAVPFQEIAPWCRSVVTRNDAAADEQIDVAVAVVVARGDARTIVVEVGEGVLREAEVAPSIVEVEPVAQRLPLPELVAAAHDIEVAIAVPVGVDEDRVDVLMYAISRECRLRRAAEAAVTTLQP